MPSHVLSTYKELSILQVRLSFGLKQTKKAAREKFRINFYKKKIVNFFPNSMEKQGANCHNLVMSWYFLLLDSYAWLFSAGQLMYE